MINIEDKAISIRNLTKKYGDVTVLDNLNFDIARNKITTILGFSGAGKSTLMKHILGLAKPTSGTVEVLGHNINELDRHALRDFRRHFGMLFQYAALFDSKTAFENVAFPLREFTSLSEKEIEEKVIDLLLSVDIKEHSFYLLPSELSGGMRKRVGLARALALSPDIMLYDEPTTGLDPITTNMVNELIVETSEKNRERAMTSLIISHDIKATLKISDFIAFLDRGRIIEYLPVDEFTESEKPLVRRFLDL